MLAQAAAVELLARRAVALLGADLGQEREREECPGAHRGGVLGRRVAHLQAALGERGGGGQVAAAAGADGGLEHEVGVVGEGREALVDRRDRGVVVADLAAGAGHPRDEQRRVADRLQPLLAQRLPRPVEVRPRLAALAQDEVLRPEVVVGEGGARLPGLLLEQLDVAAGLVLRGDALVQVAVVAHPDPRRLEALRQIGGHRVGLLLVDAAREPVLRPVAPDPQRHVGDGRAGLRPAGVVGLDEVEALPPRAAEQAAQPAGVGGLHVLVGVEVHQPVAARRLDGGVAGVGERPVPGEVHDAGAERLGDLDGAVGRSGVDHDHLVDDSAQRLEAAREHLLLVLDDHAQREREVLDRARPCCDPAAAGGEAARPGGVHTGQPRLGAGAQAGLLEVRGGIGVLGIEPQRGPEDVGGGARLAQLVEEHAVVVQEHRLAGLLLERVRETGGCGHEGPHPGVRVGPVGEHALGQAAAGLVGALAVVPPGDVGEHRGQAVEVAGGEAGGGDGDRELDPSAPVCRGCGGRAGRGDGRGAEGHRRSHRRSTVRAFSRSRAPRCREGDRPAPVNTAAGRNPPAGCGVHDRIENYTPDVGSLPIPADLPIERL